MKYTKLSLLVILVAFPTLTLVAKKVNSTTFYFLFLMGITVLAMRYKASHKPYSQILIEHWPLNLAMSSMVIAVFLCQAITGHFQFNPYDVPFRLACFAIFFQLFLLLKSKELKILQWGVVGGVFVALIFIFIQTHAGDIRPAKIQFLGIIPFSNHAMLLGFIALLSIKWQGNNNEISTTLKILALFAGLCITFLSGSRGGWLAILLYIFIAGKLFFKHDKKKTVLAIVMVMIILLSTAIFSKNIKSRINSVKTDVGSYMDGTNLDTSIGLRFQFWNSALVIIKENPLTGIGYDNYRNEMKKLSSRKIVTPVAATFPHPHNEILYQTIRYGVFGLFSILAVLFVPFFYFLKDTRHPDLQVKTTAWMGIAFCLGFFSFGLTDVVLVWRQTTMFYAFFLAALYCHLVKRKQELNTQTELLDKRNFHN